MTLEPLVHITVEGKLIFRAVKGSLEPDAERTGQRRCCAAHRHAHPDVRADHAAMFPVSCGVLEAECDLISRTLHVLQDLLCMRIVAHEHKVLALVCLEHRQHIRQLPCLHHHKNKVIEVIRRKDINGLYTFCGRSALRPVADDQTFLVDHLLPLTACKQRYNVLFVLQQHMCQLTAQNARTINQDPHTDTPPLMFDRVYLKTKKMTNISQAQAGFKANSRRNPLWISRLFHAKSSCVCRNRLNFRLFGYTLGSAYFFKNEKNPFFS